MNEPVTMIAMGSFALAGLGLFLFAALKGWRGWLELKRLELTSAHPASTHGGTMERIEMADLKERIRKLESLAACIDL
jgi:hypothetical protein